MCWFDRKHPHTLYVDCRRAPKGHVSQRPSHCVEPDDLQDFKKLPYLDCSFKLILFDPPHLPVSRVGKTGVFRKYYGALESGWEKDLSKGFDECWRVLDVHGTLVFKWSSGKIPLKKVLACFSQRPLFGHTTNNNKRDAHWLCFMKFEK